MAWALAPARRGVRAGRGAAGARPSEPPRTLKAQQPREVEPRLALARALERVGQPADAYREYREILALVPGQTDVARALARMEGRRRGPGGGD